jgi:cytoskeletal protein CcmA (bactofilin family)
MSGRLAGAQVAPPEACVKRFITRSEMSTTSKRVPRAAVCAILLASSFCCAGAYAEPVATGPLSTTGSLVVRGPLTVDGPLMVAGDIHAAGPIKAARVERISADDPAVDRRSGANTFYGPLTVHGPLVVHGDLDARGPINVGGAAGAVGRVDAEGPISERR